MWPFSAGPAYAGTLLLDGQVILKDLPLEVGAWVNSLAEVSISCDKETAAAVWIDDLELKLQDAGFSPKDKSGKTLFLMPVAKEGFESYKRKEFPFYGGFVTSQELLAEGASLPVVDNYEYAAGVQSLRLKDGEGGAALIVKRFALPERFPFDTSDGNFAITNETRIASSGVMAADSREQTAGSRAGDRERVRDRISRRQKAAQSAYAEENRVREQESARNAVTQGAVGTGAKARTLSASAAFGGSFYVYSYDGRLLAEYNGYDHCVKDYIYMGNRLLAEYKPQEDQMYFYTPDQINSTRIVTDSTGTVVYSAAHDPYGGMQKTWVNTYDPTPKFSGKERDAESELDYFGARYYDKALYRFISVDPMRSVSIFNTQRMNLYSYCMNNPISYLDPDGKMLVPYLFPSIAQGRTVHQFLDSSITSNVSVWIDSCAAAGINLEFTEAYRTPWEHEILQNTPGSGAAIGWSLHCIGFAVDINWNGLTSSQRTAVISCAVSAGLTWGGENHQMHFYVPASVTDSWVEKNYIACGLYLEYELVCRGDVSDMEIYSRYGVFTLEAAYFVMWAEIEDLYYGKGAGDVD